MYVKIVVYNRYRNKFKKEILKCLNILKSIKGGGRGMLVMQRIEQNFLFVVEVLKEVRRVIVIMVEFLFLFVCIFWFERKQSKRLMFLIFMMRFCCLEDVWDEVVVQSVSIRLEVVQIVVEEFEIELGCIFWWLIQIRVLFFNIIIVKMFFV